MPIRSEDDMVNLIETKEFKESVDDLITVGILTQQYKLTDKFWELFFKHKSTYIIETIMYPIHILFGSTNLGKKEHSYYHIVLNMVVHERPEYLESIEIEKKHVMNDADK
jgi:hypothetical protein